MSSTEFIKILRKWGWSFVAEGVKEARFKKGRNKITVRRTKDIVSGDTAWHVAQVEGLSVEKWLEGPPPVAKKETEPVKIPQVITPLPVKPQPDGTITLEEALSLRGNKINELSRTSCEIIAILSQHGDIISKDGNATRVLFEMLPNRQNKVGMPGLVSLIKQWEKAGLVWREMKHARATAKIGLCVPVKLTDDEKSRFLAEPVIEKIEPKEQEVHKHEFIGRPSRCMCGVMASMLSHEERVEYGIAIEPEPQPTVNFDPAIAILRAQVEEHQREIDHLQHAIKVLENQT